MQEAVGSNQTGSLASSDSFKQAIQQGRALRSAGRYAEALETFRKALDVARAEHDSEKEARALLAICGSHIHLFEYREALQSADEARKIGQELHDDSTVGAAASNKATVYSQLGDEVQAREAAHDATFLLRNSPNRPYFAISLINFGGIESHLGHQEPAVSALEEGVKVAHAAGAAEQEALGQQLLGECQLDARNFAPAEQAFNEALRLRGELQDEASLEVIRADLADLAFQQGQYTVALTRVNQAIASGKLKGSGVTSYWPPLLRGQILLAMGRKTDALASFQNAVTLADSWRLNALPGDATGTRTVVALHDVYESYIDLAAQQSIERHNPLLARNAFEVLAQSRAAGLRDQLLASYNRELRLPPRYLQLLRTLADLQALLTLGDRAKDAASVEYRLEQTRLELSDLENKLGVRDETSLREDDKNSRRNSLKNIQLNLTANQVLLSFTLGKNKSFLWAVTRDRLDLYDLPGEDTITAQAKSFSAAVQKGLPAPDGMLLTRELFGRLSRSAATKPEWLIVGDGALLDSVPYSALPGLSKTSGSTLIAEHNLRFLPGPLMIADARPQVAKGAFVGVADPIYNTADSRRRGSLTILPVRRTTTSFSLARLVGSDREIKSAMVRSAVPEAKILTGAHASIADLREALSHPTQIVHFAVHVVSPERQDGRSPEEAALALSLTADNVPELLTKEAIATLRVPGSLVVLSGCSSQQGKNLPSAGLVGLSRAWLLAGASAVVVSAWPTPDDSGQFFSTFYTHLQASDRSQSLARRAAEALQETQLDMQHNPGYRNSPSFWAAYSLISKE